MYQVLPRLSKLARGNPDSTEMKRSTGDSWQQDNKNGCRSIIVLPHMHMHTKAARLVANTGYYILENARVQQNTKFSLWHILRFKAWGQQYLRVQALQANTGGALDQMAKEGQAPSELMCTGASFSLAAAAGMNTEARLAGVMLTLCPSSVNGSAALSTGFALESVAPVCATVGSTSSVIATSTSAGADSTFGQPQATWRSWMLSICSSDGTSSTLQ